LLTAGGVELRFTPGTADAPNTVEPARIVLNFHVDDIRAAEARLVALEAVWVRELERTRWGIIGTVLDFDGNCVQIVEPAPDSPPCLQRKEVHP
jgi:predicted enzyme related to lactoylglutathione lyase